MLTPAFTSSFPASPRFHVIRGQGHIVLMTEHPEWWVAALGVWGENAVKVTMTTDLNLLQDWFEDHYALGCVDGIIIDESGLDDIHQTSAFGFGWLAWMLAVPTIAVLHDGRPMQEVPKPIAQWLELMERWGCVEVRQDKADPMELVQALKVMGAMQEVQGAPKPPTPAEWRDYMEGGK